MLYAEVEGGGRKALSSAVVVAPNEKLTPPPRQRKFTVTYRSEKKWPLAFYFPLHPPPC